MTEAPPTGGRVASLHLHPPRGGEPLQRVSEIYVEADHGIRGNPRYFSRRSADGSPTKRQVTLMEREQIAAHARTLNLPVWPPGTVRSNIETQGIDLLAWVGHEIRIGEAVLQIAAPRDPCAKMDAIAPGLRKLMGNNRQGILARVVRSGKIAEGDPIELLQAGPLPSRQKEARLIN